jgi:hypothetical protein
MGATGDSGKFQAVEIAIGFRVIRYALDFSSMLPPLVAWHPDGAKTFDATGRV